MTMGQVKLIKKGRKELECLKSNIIDEEKIITEFSSEVLDKIVEYINKPKGAYIDIETNTPILEIRTTNQNEAEWFIDETGYGYIFYNPRLTMDDRYDWQILCAVATAVLKVIISKIKPEKLLKQAKNVIETRHYWEVRTEKDMLEYLEQEFNSWFKPSDIVDKETFMDAKMSFEGRRDEIKAGLIEMYCLDEHQENYWLKGDGPTYKSRDRPYYPEEDYQSISSYCKNPHILKWWNKSHDELIAKRIEEKQWYWDVGIEDEIRTITPSETLKSWTLEDPLCNVYSPCNILLYFAISRAYFLGLTKKIREPKWKICKSCGLRFLENSIDRHQFRLLGGKEHIEFCSPCLSEMTAYIGSDNVTKDEVLSYLQGLARILQRVPTYNILSDIKDLSDFDASQILELLKLQKKKPTIKRLKELFGSWLNALVEAGILEDGVHRTSRGIQCLAKDGHLCRSLGEKAIDDFLYGHKIPHERESPYPEGNFRVDFSVGDIFIEYFGLTGVAEYDIKTKKKQKICRKHEIKLISIYPLDLVSVKKLESKLRAIPG